MWLSSRRCIIGGALLSTCVGLTVASGRSDALLAQQTSSAVTPVASVLQIMTVLTTPASEVVFSAVSTISTSRGVENIAPKNDRDWQKVEDNAAMLVESGNLLLTGNRVRDQGEWMKMTRDFVEASIVSLNAAKARDVNGLYASLDRLYLTCERCHLKYFP